jgi:transposase
MKKVFIGVDFSKLTFDAILIEDVNTSLTAYNIFSNDQSGYDAFITWIKEQTMLGEHTWLICGENTGLYSYSLTEYLNKASIDIWLENPLQIKRSLGITRGKNDKVDALRIAMYAYRFRDKSKSTKIREQTLQQVSDLMTYRTRLIEVKNALLIPANELFRVRQDQAAEYIHWETQNQVCYFDKIIKEVENHINALIAKDKLLYENYCLITSIKGIAFVNAIMVIVLTNNFNDFTAPRKFGSYCGIVPFSYASGTSIKSKDRVSHLANKKMKKYLTQAARAAVIHDPKLREYYIRKLQDGKDRSLIINNVRNKLIHKIFGVIKTRKPYDSNYTTTPKNAA